MFYNTLMRTGGKPLLAICVFALSFLLALLAGKVMIPILKKLKFGQEIRQCGPQSHLSKQGTPTMGGVIMIIPVLIVSLLFIPFFDAQDVGRSLSSAWVAILSMLGFGLIGFLDDYIKIAKKRSLGLRAWQKMAGQIILSLVITFWAFNNENIGSKLFVPFTSQVIDIGWFYIPLCIVFLLGLVNSVNLTDGLDGLATSVTAVNAGAYCLIFPLLWTVSSNGFEQMMSNNTTILALALLGACLGFLFYNAYPAKVFMGDTGSMALGGILCGLLIANRAMLFILIIGIMYLLSAISVILQVGSYKLRNQKRIFLMAPIHHHFELKGYHETKIVTGYTAVTLVLSVILYLSTLISTSAII